MQIKNSQHLIDIVDILEDILKIQICMIKLSQDNFDAISEDIEITQQSWPPHMQRSKYITAKSGKLLVMLFQSRLLPSQNRIHYIRSWTQKAKIDDYYYEDEDVESADLIDMYNNAINSIVERELLSEDT